MAIYYKREIEAVIQHYVTLFPGLGLTGPRQRGKLTLLRHLLNHYPKFNCRI